LVDDDVVRDDPTDPVEDGKSGEEVVGEEIPAEGAEEGIGEEAFTRDTTAITNTGVLLRVKGVEEGAGDEIGGPDHGRRLNEEATCDTTDGKANELGGHDKQPLIAKVVRLIVVDALDGHNVSLQGWEMTDEISKEDEWQMWRTKDLPRKLIGTRRLP
jgi:hypothetical protein